MQDELNRAKALIQQKRYAEARQVIKALNHPKEAEWLARIDEVERKDAVSAPPPAKSESSSARIKTSKPLPLLPEEQRAASSPPPAKSESSSARIKTSKPLPLLPDEEKELLPRGKPDDPKSILRQRLRIGGRGRAWMWLLGGKCAPLIFNYFRMGRSALGATLLLFYIAWVVAWLFCFGILFALLQQLTQSGSTHIPALLVCAVIVIGLPFSPHLIAWVQQEHYDQWMHDFNEQRRDYLSNTPYHR